MINLEDSCECGQLDYSRPSGSPWSRINYHYGQLLGTEDFKQEQHGQLNHRRLHNILLHGVGTVWGLNVDLHKQRQATIVVEPGLAIDSLGREIYIEEEQCLDVSQITRKEEIWGELDDVVIGNKKAKKAYIVIGYKECLSNVISAISPPCSNDEARTNYARVNDSFHVAISKNAPDDPMSYQREWIKKTQDQLHEDHWHSLRDRLVDFVTKQTPIHLREFWPAIKEAPVLIAEVLFFYRNDEVRKIEVNNRIRSLLPSVQLCAEQLLGQRLMGCDEREPLKIISVQPKVEDILVGGVMQLKIETTMPVDRRTINSDSVKVNLLKEGSGWASLNFGPIRFRDNIMTITFTQDEMWPDGSVFQVILSGSSSQPIIAENGTPLMGMWNEPVLDKDSGRDVSLVQTWHHIS